MPADDYTPSDLTHHLRGMIDSLDEHVTPEDIVPVLHEALQMSMDQDRGRAAHDARVRAEAGAQALRDAADHIEQVDGRKDEAVARWLRARADTITQKDTP